MNKPDLTGICVLVDGGCLNNNKPVSERSMYGSMRLFKDGIHVQATCPVDNASKRIHHRYNIPAICDHASNNLAEVVMLRIGMEYVHKLVNRMREQGQKLDSITVMSDSEWALSVVTGAYKIKACNEIPFNNDLQSIKHLKGIVEQEGCSIIFQHVDNLWVKSVLGH